MRALIVEQGWSRGALAATRALGAAGWQVGVASPEQRGLAAASRACTTHHVVPALDSSLDAFIEAVAKASVGYDVVFGAGEAELLALSLHRATLPAVLPHATHARILRSVDKAALTQAARTVGIAVPEAVDVHSIRSADSDLDETTPVVVKARLHAQPGVPGAPPRIDTLVVVGRTAALRRIADVESLGGEPQVQRFHEGTLVAYAAVRDADGVVADSLQEASRIWPPDAGASCRAVTVAPDDDLVGRAQALLAELQWYGLAELQFLVGTDAVPRLIDLNGRFYGSLSLAVAAGANLPAIWADLAVGRRPAEVVRARPGVRYQWGTADVRRALRERRGGVLVDLAQTAGWSAVARQSVLSLRDPGPAAARLRAALAR